MNKKIFAIMSLAVFGLAFLALPSAYAEDVEIAGYQANYTIYTDDGVEVTSASRTYEATLTQDKPVITLSPSDGVIYHFDPTTSDEDTGEVAEEMPPEEATIDRGRAEVSESRPDIPTITRTTDDVDDVIDPTVDDEYAEDDYADADDAAYDNVNYYEDEAEIDCVVDEVEMEDHEIYVSYANGTNEEEEFVEAMAEWSAYQGTGGCSLTSNAVRSPVLPFLLFILIFAPLAIRRKISK